MKTSNLLKQQCPRCRSKDQVFLYDKGLKLIIRFLMRDNRFLCRKCKITWLGKMPMNFEDYAKKR